MEAVVCPLMQIDRDTCLSVKNEKAMCQVVNKVV